MTGVSGANGARAARHAATGVALAPEHAIIRLRNTAAAVAQAMVSSWRAAATTLLARASTNTYCFAMPVIFPTHKCWSLLAYLIHQNAL